MMNTSITLDHNQDYRTWSPERHAAIAQVKTILRAREAVSPELFVLYNLLRGLPALRGFTPAYRRGTQANAAAELALYRVRRQAKALQVDWDASWEGELKSSLRRAHLAQFDWLCMMSSAGSPDDRWDQLSYALRRAMDETPHGTKGSVLDHGMDCWHKYHRLVNQLEKNVGDPAWPVWLALHGRALLARQAPRAVMRDYLVFHDCGKAATLEYDEQGRVHFPDHAAKSAAMWRAAGLSEDQAVLMELDMALHTLPVAAMPELASHPLAPSLLLATYAQLQSNATSVFGGFDSDGYKIKLKAFNRRAKALLTAWGISA